MLINESESGPDALRLGPEGVHLCTSGKVVTSRSRPRA